MKPVIASLALLLLSLPLEAEDPAKPKLDVHGDPIPAGADVCLGTTRFRHGGSGLQVEFTADGETLVTANIPDYGDQVSFCDVRTGKLLHELSMGEEKIKAFTVSKDRKTAAVLTALYKNKKHFLVMRLVDLVKREWISRTEWQPAEKQHVHANWGMTFTPDGLTLLMTRRSGNVFVWDVAGRQMILDYKMSLPEKTYLTEFPSISPDGETLYNVCGHNGIASWSWTAGKEPEITPFGQENVTQIAVSPDGQSIAYGVSNYKGNDDGPDVGLWDVESQRLIRGFRFSENKENVRQIEFSSDGTLLAAADIASNLICIWNTESGKRLHTLKAFLRTTDSLAFSPDGMLLAAAGGYGGAIRVWDVTTGKRNVPELEGHEIYVTLVAFPAKTTGQVFSASDDGAVFRWDLMTGRAAQTMRHSAWVRGLAVSADGRLIASSGLSDDHAVRLWDAETGQERFQFPGHGRSGGHRPVTFLKNSKQIASFGEDMNLRLWDTRSGKKVAEYPLRPSGIDFSKYRNRAVAGVETFSDTSTRSADATSVESQGPLYVDCDGSVFSPDGSLFVFSVSFVNEAYVFDTATGKELRKLELPFSCQHRAISPDNRQLAICGPEFGSDELRKQIVLSDLETGEAIWKHEYSADFKGRNGPGPVAFSPDGRLLAAAVRHGWGRSNEQGKDRIEIWNAETHEHLLTIDGIHEISGQYALSISADNRYVACGQMNSTILVWDLLEEGLPKSMIATPVQQDR